MPFNDANILPSARFGDAIESCETIVWTSGTVQAPIPKNVASTTDCPGPDDWESASSEVALPLT
jgi:hypothetical protein